MATYSGSLTTPPCPGNVLWTVFLSTKPISNRQVSFGHRPTSLHRLCAQSLTPQKKH